MEKNSYTVIGVTSFGIGCGRDDFPGVYARVTSALEWINTVIEENHCPRL